MRRLFVLRMVGRSQSFLLQGIKSLTKEVHYVL